MNRVRPKTRAQWRQWLRKHHEHTSEIWCVFSKKHVQTPSVSYDEAVEEALCFGWVDSIVRTVDADRYEQRFSPRKPGSRWSAPNVARMKKMIAARQVAPAGLAAFSDHGKRLVRPHPKKLPAELERSFRSASRAWQNFQQFPPGYRRATIGWVASAKREETKAKRLKQLIEMSARGERIAFT